jgi:cystathionine gamma-synthase
VFVASGMYAAVAMLSALVPAGGHIVTTTDCYRKTRIYMENELPKRGISVILCYPLSSTCFWNGISARLTVFLSLCYSSAFTVNLFLSS